MRFFFVFLLTIVLALGCSSDTVEPDAAESTPDAAQAAPDFAVDAEPSPDGGPEPEPADSGSEPLEG